MKKTKLILAGISLFAIVGGVLAFKSKRAYSKTFCMRLWASGCGACTGKLIGTTVNATVPYYTSNVIPDCTQERCCGASIILIKE